MWYEQITTSLEINDKIPSKRSNYKFLRNKFSSDNYILSIIDKYESENYTVRELNILAKLKIDHPGYCVVCGKRKMFIFGSNPISNYCSVECSHKDIERIKRSVKKRDSIPNAKSRMESKRKKTMILKYGVEFNSQREDIKQILKKSKLSTRVALLLNNYDWLYDQYITLDKTYLDIQREFRIDKGSIQKYINLHKIPVKTGYTISSGQKSLADFVSSLGFNIKSSIRGLLGDKREIDIYIEEKNFGIEYDGLYYHGSSTKLTGQEKKYHQKKVLDAANLGINLIRITEEEWKEYPDIVKSLISNKLGVSSTKIFARSCTIKDVSSADTKLFFQYNHLDGYSVSRINLGLFYENELVCLCSFGKPRFEKNYDWEIIRFASRLNYSIVGGFQKLLANFRKNHKGTIITYADRRISSGRVYEKAGFKLIKLTDPGYVWTDGRITYNRYQTQKHKLKSILKSFDPSETEEQNMFRNKFKVYYNCGNLKYCID